MKLSYYYKLTLKTLRSPSEWQAQLRQHTLTEQGASSQDQWLLADARKKVAHAKSPPLYSTTFTTNGFSLFLTVPEWQYQPMSRAVCVARLYPHGTGSRVELTCQAVLFLRVFMFIWGSGVTLGILSIFFGSVSHGNYRDALLTPLVMLPFPLGFWLFHKVLFKNDVDKALRFLRGIGFARVPWAA